MRYSVTAPRAQRGSSMIVIAVLMLVAALLVLMGASRSILQEREAFVTRDINLAFQAAETALREAEIMTRDTISPTSAFAAGCASGLCAPATGATQVWEVAATWTTNKSVVATSALSNLYAQPRFIIEEMPIAGPGTTAGSSLAVGIKPAGGAQPYRITAMAWGSSPKTTVMLQSTYLKGGSGGAL